MLLTELPWLLGYHGNNGISCNPHAFIFSDNIKLAVRWSY